MHHNLYAINSVANALVVIERIRLALRQLLISFSVPFDEATRPENAYVSPRYANVVAVRGLVDESTSWAP